MPPWSRWAHDPWKNSLYENRNKTFWWWVLKFQGMSAIKQKFKEKLQIWTEAKTTKNNTHQQHVADHTNHWKRVDCAQTRSFRSDWGRLMGHQAHTSKMRHNQESLVNQTLYSDSPVITEHENKTFTKSYRKSEFSESIKDWKKRQSSTWTERVDRVHRSPRKGLS